MFCAFTFVRKDEKLETGNAPCIYNYLGWMRFPLEARTEVFGCFYQSCGQNYGELHNSRHDELIMCILLISSTCPPLRHRCHGSSINSLKAKGEPSDLTSYAGHKSVSIQVSLDSSRLGNSIISPMPKQKIASTNHVRRRYHQCNSMLDHHHLQVKQLFLQKVLNWRRSFSPSRSLWMSFTRLQK